MTGTGRHRPSIAVPQTFAPPQEAYAAFRQTAAPTVPSLSACQLRLTKLADFQPLPLLAGPGECGAADAVLLRSVILPDQAKVAVTPPATLRCPMAEAVADWLREDVNPAALTLGAPLRGVDDYDSYECRGRNRVRGAMLSEHGRANAIDVRGFRLADGKEIGLTDVTAPKAWRDGIRASACARFTTVLGPGSDGYHEEHIHLDLAERHGGYRLCEWEVRVPVAEAAKPATKRTPRRTPRRTPTRKQSPRLPWPPSSCRCRARVPPTRRAERPNERRRYLPIITSEALMTAQASSPGFSASSATASLVIDAVMTAP